MSIYHRSNPTCIAESYTALFNITLEPKAHSDLWVCDSRRALMKREAEMERRTGEPATLPTHRTFKNFKYCPFSLKQDR